jgi:hypothetical protein
MLQKYFFWSRRDKGGKELGLFYCNNSKAWPMDEWTIKTPNPWCRLFSEIDLLMDFAALRFTDFIDRRYIPSWLVFSTQLVNCCPHRWMNYTCEPLYLLSDLTPPPQTKYTAYTDSVWLWGWHGEWGVLSCVVDHILQKFYTLLLTRFRTYKIASTPQTKWPVKTTVRDWCL